MILSNYGTNLNVLGEDPHFACWRCRGNIDLPQINVTSASSACKMWIFSQNFQVCTTFVCPMFAVVPLDWIFVNFFAANTAWLFWVISLGWCIVITHQFFCLLLLIFKPLDSRFYFQYWKQILNNSSQSASITKSSAYNISQVQTIQYSIDMQLSTTLFAFWFIVPTFHVSNLILELFLSFIFLPLTAYLDPVWGCWGKPLISTVTPVWGWWYAFLFTWQESGSCPFRVCVFWLGTSFMCLRPIFTAGCPS